MDVSEKAVLRRTVLEKRDAMDSAQMRKASDAISSRLEQMPEFSRAARVGIYHSTGSEVRTRDLLRRMLAKQKRVCLPMTGEYKLDFGEVTNIAQLRRGRFGIMEPDSSCPPREPDFLVIPAVCLARDGSRIGYGRGYYDRFLARYNGISAALSYMVQLVGRIPSEPHDKRVDWIVTEEETIKTDARLN